MLQSQFYNSNLNNKHINKIIENYNIKYSRMKNEIESKMNSMIKSFLKDVLEFLENIEEIAEQKKKISNYERIKKELELIKTKLKDKTISENKLKSDFDLIKQENTLLKLKIKSLTDKISNFRRQNPSPSPPQNAPNVSKKINTPKSGLKTEFFKLKSGTPKRLMHNLHTRSTDDKKKRSLLSKGFREDKHNKSCTYIDKKQLKINYDKLIKERNLHNNKKKKINARKFVNNNIKTRKEPTRNLSDNEYFLEVNDDKILPPSSPSDFQKYNTKKSSNKGTNSTQCLNNIYSNDTAVNLSLDLQQSNCLNVMSNAEYEEMGSSLNSMLDDELKELEEDEKNVKLLMEQFGLNAQNM